MNNSNITREEQFDQGDWFQALNQIPIGADEIAKAGDLAIFVESDGEQVLVLIRGSKFQLLREVFISNFVKVENGETLLNEQINELIREGQTLAGEINAGETEITGINLAFQLNGQHPPEVLESEVPTSTDILTIRKDLIIRKMGEEIARKRNLLTDRINRLSEIQSAIRRLLAQKSALAEILLSFTDFSAKLNTVLTTLNLYLGTGEEILQLRQGKWAKEGVKLAIRQLVCRMDEESLIAGENGGMDFNDLTKFDQWLLSDEKHLNQILPEEKGIVCLKPRRKEKSYSDQPIVNHLANEKNFETYFLIRNGENLFRVCPSWTVGEKLFPSRREFELLMMEKEWNSEKGKYEYVTLKPGHYKLKDKEKELRKRTIGYRQTLTLLQGILDRTGIFPELQQQGVNLLDLAENLSEVNYVYDADESYLLGRGLESFPQFRKNVNSQLRAGDRFIGVFPWRWDEYGRSEKGFRPNSNVVYTIEKAVGNKLYFKFERGEVFRDDPLEGYGYYPSKKRVTTYIMPDDDFVLAYDLVSVDQLEDFLTDRVARQDYADLIPFLQKLKKSKAVEEAQELPFIELCAGRLLSGDNSLKPEVLRRRIRELVNWWKFKTKQVRTISVDESKALRMIESEYRQRFNKDTTENQSGREQELITDQTLWLGKKGSSYLRWIPVNEDHIFITEEKFGWK
ncbi:MAG TPA: hypothetical protein PKY82_30505, partial [Pyrinomonadaceae bacterium]|nr:hypothetical protein [Pyrinomonadaceae bacterium]